MSKIILKFDIPEEQSEANIAIKAGEYFVVLHDIDQKLRDITKYSNNPFSGKPATMQEIQLAEQLRQYLREQNIDELWR